MGHESHAADSKPQRLRNDKAYDMPHLRRWLWGKRIGVRIARKGIDSSERLGRRGLASALCCYKRFLKLTM